MNDQIKREDQLPEEAPTETYARFAQGVFDVARVVHQELQTIAEKSHRIWKRLHRLWWRWPKLIGPPSLLSG
jgi:hypothetical protein